MMEELNKRKKTMTDSFLSTKMKQLKTYNQQLNLQLERHKKCGSTSGIS
jgi:hypothetical protein